MSNFIETHSLYNGEVTLKFDNRQYKHIYTVNNEVVFGVTNIVGVINKPALMYWAVNQAIENLTDLWKPGVAYDEIQISEMLGNAKKAHRTTSGRAADIGTIGHDWVHKHIEARMGKKLLPPMPVNPELKEGVKGFLKWEKEHNVEFLLSEKKIYSKKYGFAGTLDIEAKVDGLLSVVDIKFSNSIYQEYFLQATSYLVARIEETKQKYPGGIHILRLNKAKPKKGVEPFEAIQKKRPLKELRVFLGCLEIYKWQMDNKKKEFRGRYNKKTHQMKI